MRIVRKLIDFGSQENPSKAITLPKSWLKSLEHKFGKPIDEVALYINGTVTLVPIIKGKEMKEE